MVRHQYTQRQHLNTGTLTGSQSNSTLYSSPFDSVNSSRVSSSQPNQPIVGVIDTGYSPNDHGTMEAKAIAQTDHRPPDWLGDGVGKGRWAESLRKFVDVVKSSGGNRRAVANLGFDLTDVNPDGKVSTRQQLTDAEKSALDYAQKNGVLLVASAGNQNGEMSALGQASQKYNNIITVGASDGSQRASYSSEGRGLDLLAPGKTSIDGKTLTGTSVSAGEVTGTVAQMLAANSKMSNRQIIHTLESTAKDLNTPGRDDQTGFGVLNPTAAIEAARNSVPKSPASSRTSERSDLMFFNPTISPTANSAGNSIVPSNLLSVAGPKLPTGSGTTNSGITGSGTATPVQTLPLRYMPHSTGASTGNSGGEEQSNPLTANPKNGTSASSNWLQNLTSSVSSHRYDIAGAVNHFKQDMTDLFSNFQHDLVTTLDNVQRDLTGSGNPSGQLTPQLMQDVQNGTSTIFSNAASHISQTLGDTGKDIAQIMFSPQPLQVLQPSSSQQLHQIETGSSLV